MGNYEVGLKHPEEYPYEEIKKQILNAPTEQLRAFSALIYASGVRVSELIQIEGRHINKFVEEGGIEVIKIYTPTLKNPTNHDRFIPVSIAEETWLTDLIFNYAATHQDKMFPFHRATIWRWCVKYFGFNPHGFRKIRGTHLVMKYRFTDQHLIKFMGWTDSRPAKAYIKLNTADIIPMVRH